MKEESVFGREPARAVEDVALEAAATASAPGVLVGHAAFGCDCGGVVDTRQRRSTTVAEEGVSKHVGCPCSGCDRTYTAEVTWSNPRDLGG